MVKNALIVLLSEVRYMSVSKTVHSEILPFNVENRYNNCTIPQIL